MADPQPWDGLPLNTPTLIPGLGAPGFEAWVTRYADGGGIEGRPIAGTAEFNRRQLVAAAAAALVRLRQIQTQAAAMAAVPNYATALPADLNDLLAKTKLIAAAVNDIAADLVVVARLVGQQLDGTT